MMWTLKSECLRIQISWSPGAVRLLGLLPAADHVGAEVLLHGRAGAHQVLVPEGVIYPPDTWPQLGVRPKDTFSFEFLRQNAPTWQKARGRRPPPSCTACPSHWRRFAAACEAISWPGCWVCQSYPPQWPWVEKNPKSIYVKVCVSQISHLTSFRMLMRASQNLSSSALSSLSVGSKRRKSKH